MNENSSLPEIMSDKMRDDPINQVEDVAASF